MDIHSVLLTPEELKIRDEVREFVKWVPHDLLKKMDREEIDFPYEYDREVSKRNLIGLRFPKKWGGRDQKWTCECAAIEEIAVLGTALACQYSLPSIVGEAINLFGNDMQKEKFLKPTLEGKLICAEALTEPRGGSDFFGCTTTARKDGNNYILTGAKRFIVGGKGADYFLVYVKTDPKAEPHKSISVMLVERPANTTALVRRTGPISAAFSQLTSSRWCPGTIGSASAAPELGIGCGAPLTLMPRIFASVGSVTG